MPLNTLYIIGENIVFNRVILPVFTTGTEFTFLKLSSGMAFIILKKWYGNYDRTPDTYRSLERIRMTNNDWNEEIELFGRMHIALNELEMCRDLAPLIPEVRTNCAYARPCAQNPRDVVAVDGRITVVNGMPKAAGSIQFGASSHLARFIIELMKTDPQIRTAINFANSPAITCWLENYCSDKEWKIARINREDEPDDSRNAEGNSMAWKVRTAIRATGGIIPKIICDAGGIGKEPVCIITGNEPVLTAHELCGIAHDWARQVT